MDANNTIENAKNATPVVLDGSEGEGGGQIVRSALSLSLITGRPVQIDKIRAKRRRTGLMRQHLTAVQTAARIGAARVEGAAAGSSSIHFVPGALQAGTYHVPIGTAGSTTLVAQTVIPALLAADGPSTVRIEGGTHNPMCPPFDFLERTFVPALERMGARVTATLERHGFYPAGGGAIQLTIQPSPLVRIELLERGEVRRIRARCVVADLPVSIAEREAEVLRKKLGLKPDAVEIRSLPDGPGNVATVDVETDAGTIVFTSFGEKRVPAEKVASNLVREVKNFLRAERAAVDEHLADQLLLPMALAGGGAFRTTRATPHATTNAAVIEAFLPVSVTFTVDGDSTLVEVAPKM